MSAGRHDPLPHIVPSALATKLVYRKTVPLATHLATELREHQDPDGLEWRCPGPHASFRGRGWIARSVFSCKGNYHQSPDDRGIACNPSVIWRFISKRVFSCCRSVYRLPLRDGAGRGRSRATGGLARLMPGLTRQPEAPPALPRCPGPHAGSSSPGPSSGGLAARAGGAAGLRAGRRPEPAKRSGTQMRGSSHARGPARRAEIAVTIDAALS